MQINQNIAAMNAQRNLMHTQGQLDSSLEKLSSGFRINRAADDAAGLVNSENLRAQIGGLGQAQSNAQDAISMIQTAEGAQTEVHASLQRMRDLVVDSGNLGTNDQEALQANQSEIDQLVAELDRISEQTQFGTQTILEGGTVWAEDGSGDAVTVDGSVAGAGDAEALFGALDTVLGQDDDNLQLDGLSFLGSSPSDLLQDIEVDLSEITTDIDGDGVVAVDLTDTSDGTLTLSDEVDADLTTAQVDAAEEAIAATIGEALDAVRFDDNTQLSDYVSVDSVTVESGENGDITVAFSDVETAPQQGVGVGVVDPDSSAEFVFQVGANAGQRVSAHVGGVSAEQLGVDDIDVVNGGETGIDNALAELDNAISTVSENRGELGALQNRMEATTRNLGVAQENLQAAESRIRDTDMASEMVEFTRHQILQQAGTSMLAQANMVPQSVLGLLQ